MKRRSFIGLIFGGLSALLGFKKSKSAVPVVRPRPRTGLELKYPDLPILEESELKPLWWKPYEDTSGPFSDYTGFHASPWKSIMVKGAPSENEGGAQALPYKPIDWSTL